MPRYAVLLRGINVGSAKRVAMADLKELLTDAGFEDVRTHLNSGNVVLTGKSAPPKRIEKAITDRTGLSVSCVVLTAKQLRAIIDGHPFADVATNGSRMMAHVLGGTPSEEKLADALARDPDNARSGPGVIYQWWRARHRAQLEHDHEAGRAAVGTDSRSARRPSASSKSAGRRVTSARTKWNAARTFSGGTPARSAQANR